jgi:tetratricopeptide (TPR) repeat protein
MKLPLIILLIFSSSMALSSERLGSESKSKIQGSNSKLNTNIHKICESSYDLCLSLIPQYLNENSQYSRLWYAYKLYQLEALSALERFDELERELLPIISKQDLPEKFHIYSNILYAKIIQYKGNSELALRYFNEAKELLLAVNIDWPKPLELIKIANLLLYMKEYQIGYDMLLGLDEKFTHFTDANFKYRLYTNLGHFALNLGDHQSHIDYRQNALQWADLSNNINMKAIANFNVARAHFFIESFEIAIIYFKHAISEGLKASNQSLVDKAYLNLADIYHQQNEQSCVNEMLAYVEHTVLSGNYVELFQKLSQENQTKKPGDKPGKSKGETCRFSG